MQRINPNSSIRSGYKFEDLYVLKLCVDWLKSPEKFKKILIQYIPDEVQNSRFSIDDVVVVDKDNNYLFHQLKYKQNPASDLWTFDKLIEKGLLKWIKSFQDLQTVKVAGCYFITNGSMGTDISACYSKEKISLNKIKLNYPSIYNKLKGKSFNGELLKLFFSNFCFYFNYPEKHAFENELRDILHNELKVIKSGIDSLLLYIANQGAEKEPKTLTLTEIRSHLSWDNPRPLNQNFEVPADFEFFDKHTHEDIINDLKSPQGGIKVIIGKPGTGKSTYLSKLYAIIQNNFKIPAARHHYHINPKDSSLRDRLNADRVREALRADFKKQKKEVIGELSFENTEHTPLREFLSKIASFYYTQKKSFVLIIDGLDHVIREGRHEDELKEFLNEIMYPQPGLWIIFGTQEMAVPFFPNVLYKYAATDKWIEIKGLKKSAVQKIVFSKSSEFDLPANKDLYHEIAEEIYKKTTGNPLHLRYVLNQLKTEGNRINSYDLESILPYKNEIKEYYEDLWRHLPSSSKTMCFAISTLDFKLQEEQLFELSGYFLRSPAKLTEAYNQVKHLVRIDLYGISVYHNSFLVFLLNQPELNQQKHLLYKHIRNLLKRSGIEGLKWSELAKVEYYLGNAKPLLALDKNWVINSFLECRDQDQIQKLLELAVEASFKQRDFQKVIYFKLLVVNFENRHYNLFDTLQKIWVTSFASKNKLQIPYPDFSKFNHYQIKELLLALKHRGQLSDIPEEAIDRFNDFFADRDYEKDAIIRSWIEVLVGFDDKTSRVYTFIIQFRKNKDSAQYFSYYLSRSIIQGKYKNIRDLLKLKLLPDEKRAVTEILIREDLITNLKKWKTTVKKLKGSGFANHLEVFYATLNDVDISVKQKLSSQLLFPSKLEIHGTKTAETLELYRANFYIGLSLCMSHKEQTVLNWIKSTEKRWVIQLMNVLFTAAIYLVKCLKARQRIYINDLLHFFDDLPVLNYDDDYEIFEFRRSIVPNCLIEIIELGTFSNVRNKFSNCLGVEDVKIITKCKWLYPDNITTIWRIDTITLSDEAFIYLKDTQANDLKNEIIPFKDRAEKYADLAILAKELGKAKELDELLLKAAENIISYGHHKYMLLHKLIRSIEICGDAGSVKVKEYIKQIAKYVYHIRELTDGDETGSFMYDFSTLLAKFDKSLLYNLYFHSIKNRDYYQNEHLFADILTTLNFSKPVDFAIGNTAIDKNAYNTLLYLSKTNADSKKLLSNIWRTFGRLDYEERENATSSSNYKAKKDVKDYNKISPDDLGVFLTNLKSEGPANNKYERIKYLSNWAKHWLGKKNAPISKTLLCLKTIIEPQIDQINKDILLLIYPHAYRADKNFAFDCLMWAQANSSSWGDEYSHKLEESRDIWMKVIRNYPDRIDEFFEKSIINSGRYYHRQGTGQVPIPKGTQFFVDSGRLPIAEKITEYYIDSIDMLFPDVNLQIPDFMINERPISEFDILMTRFEGLSPIIRERSGLYLSQLLENDKSGKIHRQFFKWLSNNKLESYACNGLLVIIKSLQNKKSCSYKFVRISELGKIIQVRCRATDLLIMNIAERLNQKLVIKAPYVMSWSNTAPDITEDKFFKIALTHLPFVYQDYINDLQKKTHISVWALWYEMYRSECDYLNIIETKEDRDYGNTKRDYMIGRSTIFSDVLKSTFLRLTDILVELQIINHSDIFFYTIKNFQIDPSVWNIRLSAKPRWWPSFKESSAPEAPRPAELNCSLRELIFNDGKDQVLHLSGSITPNNLKYDNIVEGSIYILPFGFKILGSNLPEASEIYDKLSRDSGFWYPKVQTYQNFCTLENELKFTKEAPFIKLKDLEITPLVGNLRFSIPHMWQYYRWFHDFKILSPIISNSLQFVVKRNKINYNQKGNTIAVCDDFLDGIKIISNYDHIMPAGNFIRLNKKYLTDFLKDSGINLGYVIKTKYRTWKYSYSDDFTETDFFDTLDYSPDMV